ncbi:hypothetical protein ACKKBF_B05405 [Auxenochlorella protothecoides x Auxenochlorella symbiontica]|uniref:CBS domain-containing protein n=1 Tax=Auxenochlorella protothecoides TaxID=3075 RepID=A0A1D2AFP5_AUXPR|nr:hypothetical protein APUTEX25_002536 [Auxenochlorella protothecoides]|eukprot:RMZ53959.1 hypothetical protein APUTEX25_002536 [Auxenochlorella protothecoides]
MSTSDIKANAQEVLAPVHELLQKTPTSALCKPKQDIVTLRQNLSIGDAMQILAKRGILSAPIVLEPDLEEMGGLPEERELSPQLLGWLDVSDILRAFLDHLKRGGDLVPSKMLALMSAIEKAAPSFISRMLITIPSIEDRNLLYASEAGTTPLSSTIRDLFLRPSEGGMSAVVHRIALFGPHGDITNIVSQMDVIKFLAARPEALGPLADATLGQLGVLDSAREVVSVDPLTPTLAAFAMLASRQLAGAPVVADTGDLIANLSISDLRTLTGEHLGVLALPVAEFLALRHDTTYIGYSVHTSSLAQHAYFNAAHRQIGPGKNDIALFTVVPATTFKGLLAKFVERHVHRVYVVESLERPRVCAVITLTDVLRLVTSLAT